MPRPTPPRLRTTRRAAAHALLAALLAAAGARPARAQAASAAAAAGPTLVVLVRHAEKAAAPADDPPLDSAGTARAQALRVALADAGVQHVIATPRRRTSDTARPLTEARGLTAELVPLTAGASHVAAVAQAVRRQAGRVVLVVGHSNTIPAIIGALGGPRMADLCDAEHAKLFVLALSPDGRASLVRSQYGPADPAGASSCAAGAMR
jgi:broad specificity phosphatase PhoE